MTDTKPEALRLAEIVDRQSLAWIEGTSSHIERVQTSAELRRLHEVNAELLAANKDSLSHFDALMADHKKLQGVQQELLEALKAVNHSVKQGQISGNDWRRELCLCENITKRAIAKAEVTK